MSEIKTSISDVMPLWMTQEQHIVVSGETALFKNNTLAVTQSGLTAYPQAFAGGLDEFKRFNAQMYTNGRSIAGSVVVPKEFPDLVIKREAEHGIAVPTLCTLSAIQNIVPQETDEYLFHKLGLYWAFDLPSIGMIAMERVKPVEIHHQDEHKRYLEARKRFLHESKQAGFSVNPLPYQDLLYLGHNEEGKPIITLVDEIDENIMSHVDSHY